MNSIKLKALMFSFALVATMHISPALATEPSQEEVQAEIIETSNASEINTLQEVDNKLSARQKVNEQIEQYLNKHGYNIGNRNKKGRIIYKGVEDVTGTIVDANFENRKILTFAQAYEAALTEFISNLGSAISVETAKSFYSDASEGQTAEDINEASTFDVILDKTLALTDAGLDKALKEFGIDPAKYNSAPPVERRKLLSNGYSRLITQEATRSISGINVLQNFIEFDEEGHAAVGVIICYSPIMQSVADSLRTGQKPALPSVDKSIEDYFDFSNKELMYKTLGTRLIADENGPVIVAFGQGSSSYTGSNQTLRNSRIKHAEISADQDANAKLSEFLGQTLSVRTSSDMEELTEVYEDTDLATGTKEGFDANSFTNITMQQSKTHSKNFMQGLQTIKNWSYTTPQGHEVVGVVKIYNFAGIDAAKNVTRPKQDPEEAQKLNVPSGSEGFDTPDLDIF